MADTLIIAGVIMHTRPFALLSHRLEGHLIIGGGTLVSFHPHERIAFMIGERQIKDACATN